MSVLESAAHIIGLQGLHSLELLQGDVLAVGGVEEAVLLYVQTRAHHQVHGAHRVVDGEGGHPAQVAQHRGKVIHLHH